MYCIKHSPVLWDWVWGGVLNTGVVLFVNNSGPTLNKQRMKMNSRFYSVFMNTLAYKISSSWKVNLYWETGGVGLSLTIHVNYIIWKITKRLSAFNLSLFAKLKRGKRLRWKNIRRELTDTSLILNLLHGPKWDKKGVANYWEHDIAWTSLSDPKLDCSPLPRTLQIVKQSL